MRPYCSATLTGQETEEENIDRKSIQIDQLGIFLLAVGIGSLQYVLERGEADDWFDSKSIMWLAVAAVIAIPAFIWWELRGTKEPVVDLRALKNRNLAVGSILMVVIGYGLFTSVLLYPLFAQRIVGLTATQTGQLLIPGGLVTLPMFALVGRLLAKKVSPRLLVALGTLLSLLSASLCPPIIWMPPMVIYLRAYHPGNRAGICERTTY